MHLGDPGDPPRGPRPAARLLLVGLAAALRPSAISGLTLEHVTRRRHRAVPVTAQIRPGRPRHPAVAAEGAHRPVSGQGARSFEL